jgi:hypothetical protein
MQGRDAIRRGGIASHTNPRKLSIIYCNLFFNNIKNIFLHNMRRYESRLYDNYEILFLLYFPSPTPIQIQENIIILYSRIEKHYKLYRQNMRRDPPRRNRVSTAKNNKMKTFFPSPLPFSK